MSDSSVLAGPVVHERIYVDGAWRPSAGSETIDVVDPATEEVIGSVPAGDAQDVDVAARAAAAALPAWSGREPAERAALCTAIAAGLRERQAELAHLIARELGMPVSLAHAIQLELPIAHFALVADIVAQTPFEERIGNALVTKEPVGVVGAITPWNYPLNQIAAKTAAALAAGCTIVLKPSEVTPLNAFALAEVMHEAGLPAGVFNLVSGDGPTVGEALACHPLVDMVSFTGSTRAGRRVGELAAQTVKRTALELGGKSANVVLDDCGDALLAQAVDNGVANCLLNSGQTCSALTRMLVPRARLGEVEQLVAGAVERYAPGDPLDPSAILGPLVSAAQRDRVVSYIEQGLAEGARLVCGGPERPEGRERGFFVRPTVFSDVTADMVIAREEIFGPVLVLMPHDGDDAAVAMANDNAYGLSGGVWSADDERAMAVARRIRTGQVAVNGAAFNPLAPFGGFKQSGYGREYGRYGLEEFLVPKAVLEPLPA